MQPAACASIRGTVNASTPEDLILNRSANGSVMQALIIFRFAVYGGFRIMLTHKDAKMMARSLRDALGNRNVLLSQRLPGNRRATIRAGGLEHARRQIACRGRAPHPNATS